MIVTRLTSHLRMYASLYKVVHDAVYDPINKVSMVVPNAPERTAFFISRARQSDLLTHFSKWLTQQSHEISTFAFQ